MKKLLREYVSALGERINAQKGSGQKLFESTGFPHTSSHHFITYPQNCH